MKLIYMQAYVRFSWRPVLFVYTITKVFFIIQVRSQYENIIKIINEYWLWTSERDCQATENLSYRLQHVIEKYQRSLLLISLSIIKSSTGMFVHMLTLIPYTGYLHNNSQAHHFIDWQYVLLHINTFHKL